MRRQMKTIGGKEGLSPLLAIIIGLVVTIVAGILLAQLYFSYAAAVSSRPSITVEYVDLTGSPGGSGTLVVNVKNTGNVPVTTLEIDPDPANQGDEISCNLPDGSLDSGQVVGCSASVTIGSDGSWNGIVHAEFADGSVQNVAIVARARSA